MWEDPIVADVHRIRRELAAQFNDDVFAIVADIRKRQVALGSRLVSLVPPAERTPEAGPNTDPRSQASGATGTAPAA
jgi:hypothetical protein